MAKEARRIEQDFLATIEEKTGHILQGWMDIIAASGETKSQAILKWLKQNYELNHLQANMLSGIFMNDGKPVHDYDVLFARLFDGKDSQKPVYEVLLNLIQTDMEDVLFIPTKTYISIEAKKVFACAKINKKNIRLGLDLGDMPFNENVVQAKALGAMPNITHMIELSDVSEITSDVLNYVKQAYDRLH
jgi:predicted transport protein